MRKPTLLMDLLTFHIIYRNSYFYTEKWTFKVMCNVYYRAKRDKKEET